MTTTPTIEAARGPGHILDDPLIGEDALIGELPDMTRDRWRDWIRRGVAPRPDIVEGHSRWYRRSTFEAWLDERAARTSAALAHEGVAV